MNFHFLVGPYLYSSQSHWSVMAGYLFSIMLCKTGQKFDVEFVYSDFIYSYFLGKHSYMKIYFLWFPGSFVIVLQQKNAQYSGHISLGFAWYVSCNFLYVSWTIDGNFVLYEEYKSVLRLFMSWLSQLFDRIQFMFLSVCTIHFCILDIKLFSHIDR